MTVNMTANYGYPVTPYLNKKPGLKRQVKYKNI
jgi:hypothetical protein